MAGEPTGPPSPHINRSSGGVWFYAFRYAITIVDSYYFLRRNSVNDISQPTENTSTATCDVTPQASFFGLILDYFFLNPGPLSPRSGEHPRHSVSESPPQGLEEQPEPPPFQGLVAPRRGRVPRGGAPKEGARHLRPCPPRRPPQRMGLAHVVQIRNFYWKRVLGSASAPICRHFSPPLRTPAAGTGPGARRRRVPRGGGRGPPLQATLPARAAHGPGPPFGMRIDEGWYAYLFSIHLDVGLLYDFFCQTSVQFFSVVPTVSDHRESNATLTTPG